MLLLMPPTSSQFVRELESRLCTHVSWHRCGKVAWQPGLSHLSTGPGLMRRIPELSAGEGLSGLLLELERLAEPGVSLGLERETGVGVWCSRWI
jgi:hypothetical protein